MDNNQPENYTAAITELDELVKKMQDSNCSIDDLSGYTTRAKVLLDYCRARLLQTDENIKKILAEIEKEG